MRIVDPPEVPLEPAGYRKYYIPLAIAIGIVVGILLAFTREYFDQEEPFIETSEPSA